MTAAGRDVEHWKSHAEEAGRGFAQVCRDYARVSARNVELIRRMEALTFASDDGTEYMHNGHDPSGGEPECPGCWVAGIRAALAPADTREGEAHPDRTFEP